MKKVCTELKSIILTMISALISSFALHMFISNAGFAPAGVDGICVMLAQITDISMGLFSLLINLPLLVAAWFVLKKRYVIYTVLFTAFSSTFLMILEAVDFYRFSFPEERLLVALISGAILGARTGMMLKIGASTGGIDIIAGLIRKFNGHINVERLITVICSLIAVVSVFIYRDVLSILLSLVQMVVFDKVASIVLTDVRNAVEFKIITKTPQKLTDRIIRDLKHGATVLECRGAFEKNENSIILTVVNVRQIPEFLKILEEENAFVYYSDVKGIKGNFRWSKNDAVK